MSHSNTVKNALEDDILDAEDAVPSFALANSANCYGIRMMTWEELITAAVADRTVVVERWWALAKLMQAVHGGRRQASTHVVPMVTARSLQRGIAGIALRVAGTSSAPCGFFRKFTAASSFLQLLLLYGSVYFRCAGRLLKLESFENFTGKVSSDDQPETHKKYIKCEISCVT